MPTIVSNFNFTKGTMGCFQSKDPLPIPDGLFNSPFLKFHSTRGYNISMSHDGTKAERKTEQSFGYCKAILFSHRLISIGTIHNLRHQNFGILFIQFFHGI